MTMRAILSSLLLVLPFLAQPAAAQDAAAGERSFNKCRACHQVGESARNMVGKSSGSVMGSLGNPGYSKVALTRAGESPEDAGAKRSAGRSESFTSARSVQSAMRPTRLYSFGRLSTAAASWMPSFFSFGIIPKRANCRREMNNC